MKNLYVAVVMTEDGISLKPDGDLAAFVEKKESKAVQKALAAARKCGSKSTFTAGRGYWVAVGQLTARVDDVPNYTIVPFVKRDE